MEKKGVLAPMLLAMGAAVFYLLVLSSKERALTGAYEQGEILIARVDIPERTILKEDMVEAAAMPRRFMDQDVFEVRTPSDFKLIRNLVTRVRIPKGNQITQSALISMSPEAGLSVAVPPGYRGAVLPIEPEMKALIKPGDRVDVLVTFDAFYDGHREKATATILQNVLVLAVGNDLGKGVTAKQFKDAAAGEDKSAAMGGKAMVSLALNPDELEYLALAMDQGRTTVAVRGLGDNDLHPIPIASLSRLLGGRQ